MIVPISAFIFTLISLSSGFAYQRFTSTPTSLQRWHTMLHASPVYLERMVERKKAEVESLLRRHQAMDDPLVMRMGYMASECR